MLDVANSGNKSATGGFYKQTIEVGHFFGTDNTDNTKTKPTATITRLSFDKNFVSVSTLNKK